MRKLSAGDPLVAIRDLLPMTTRRAALLVGDLHELNQPTARPREVLERMKEIEQLMCDAVQVMVDLQDMAVYVNDFDIFRRQAVTHG